MLIVSRKVLNALMAAVVVCGLSLVVAGVALWNAHATNQQRDAYAQQNRELITRLAQAQADLAGANARDARNVALAQQRLLALTRFALGLQGQVRTLGATPLPLPSELRSAPAFESPTPSPTPGPTATPPASPSPRPTASPPRPGPSASPTPSAACVNVRGLPTVCIPPVQ